MLSIIGTDYRRGDGLDTLLAIQYAIAGQQDPYHCAVCDHHLDEWRFGFPFPLCVVCVSRKAGPRRLCCPWPVRRPCRREKCGRALAAGEGKEGKT